MIARRAERRGGLFASQGPRYIPIMSTLAKIKASGEGLMANCAAGANCGHGKRLDIDMLIGRFGPDYEMVNERRIAAACKCERCGHKGAVIHIVANSTPNGYAKARGGQ